MKRPKKCPACNSSRITEKEPFTCKRCGYTNDFGKKAELRRFRPK